MFDSKHYVPILKWKAAERQALEHLGTNEKQFITPVIQIVMPNPKMTKEGEPRKSTSEQLNETIVLLKERMPLISEEIIKHWGKTPAFLDVSLVDSSLRNEGFKKILRNGHKSGAFLIPVISLNADPEIQQLVVSIAKENKSGLCLRLSINDCSNQAGLEKKLQSFLQKHNLSEKEVDILADFKENHCLELDKLGIQIIPNITKWRTFTFACGSFPQDLSNHKVGEENYEFRSDWNNWFLQIQSEKMQRKPSFGDYAIQHPIYKEATRFFSPSASIRYTLKDKWLILRGQKGKSTQYLAHARLLSQDRKFRSMFFGADFSFGDAYIAEKGKNLKGKPGNPTTWLVAGINHHLACTISQIASLT